MRLNRCGSTVLNLLVLLAASGCQGNRTIAGPTPPPVADNVSAATAIVNVRVEGRVIDGDRDEPVPGAVVIPTQVCAPGACVGLNEPAARAVADDQGGFVLTVNLPPAWRELLLSVTRDGYEPTQMYVAPAAATTALLRLLPTLTIRSGDSIDTRVLIGTHACGFESWPCRRVVVEPPSGESMDLEVIPADGQEVTLVVGPEASHPFTVSIRHQVTMSAGEVWIYGAPGRVTLTAHRR